MPYKQVVFANNEYYHVFNRGVEKRQIFLVKRDYQRFLETLIYYQNANPPVRFSFSKTRGNPKVKKLAGIICYTLMPTHFHILLRQTIDNGITDLLSKISNSYTKFFNTKYKRAGALFTGPFKAVRIEDDEQLLHVNRYIHLNPLIDFLTKDLRLYDYSSYQEYLGISRPGICDKEPVLSHFKSTADYEKFVLDHQDYGRKIKQIEKMLFEERDLSMIYGK